MQHIVLLQQQHAAAYRRHATPRNRTESVSSSVARHSLNLNLQKCTTQTLLKKKHTHTNTNWLHNTNTKKHTSISANAFVRLCHRLQQHEEQHKCIIFFLEEKKLYLTRFDKYLKKKMKKTRWSQEREWIETMENTGHQVSPDYIPLILWIITLNSMWTLKLYLYRYRSTHEQIVSLSHVRTHVLQMRADRLVGPGLIYECLSCLSCAQRSGDIVSRCEVCVFVSAITNCDRAPRGLLHGLDIFSIGSKLAEKLTNNVISIWRPES